MLLTPRVAKMLLHLASKQAEVQEKAAAVASILKWAAWLAEGPGNSLKKLHRFSREATGWTESAKSKGESEEVGDDDDIDGLSKEELEALRSNQSDTGEPVNAQAEANDQAEAWAIQWGSKNPRPMKTEWPLNMGPPPAKLMVEAICQAAMTFPVGTGLGWDGIHPRAICRLSKSTLEWLAEVLHHCETTGEWPEAIDVVIIALLPKSDGG